MRTDEQQVLGTFTCVCLEGNQQPEQCATGLTLGIVDDGLHDVNQAWENLGQCGRKIADKLARFSIAFIERKPGIGKRIRSASDPNG